MGITVGAAMKKVAAILLSDPKTLKKVLFAILVVLVALLLPMVMVVCLFSGKFRVDTEDLQRHVEANLTAADVQPLRSVEDTMAEIEFAMIDAELSSEVGAAQALYIMALYDYSSQPVGICVPAGFLFRGRTDGRPACCQCQCSLWHRHRRSGLYQRHAQCPFPEN